jgi:hypothetical protein
MASIGQSAVVAAATLLGVLIPLTFNYFHDRAQTAERRQFRNHDRRAAIAGDYLISLGRFRRSVRAYAGASAATVTSAKGVMIEAARDLDDNAQLLRLYFNPMTAEAESAARKALVSMQHHAEDMHNRQVELERDGDLRSREWTSLYELDDDGKRLRDNLVLVMQPQLGEGPTGNPAVLKFRSHRS